MEDHSELQPYSDIVPILIGLCAKPVPKDRENRKARTNALFSILNSSVVIRPAISTHWLLALHGQAPRIRPASVQHLMSRALRNSIKINPEQALILSAEILNQTEPDSGFSGIAKNAFCRAFDTALQKDREVARVPFIAGKAVRGIFDDRGDELKAYIRHGLVMAQIQPQR